MEKEWLYALLAVILILVLLFVPAKIRDVYNVFIGIGNEELGDLTKLRADCTKLVDNNEPIDRCALDVAEATLKAKKDPIMAERWLRIQIKQGEEKYLKESFDFAKVFYPAVIKDSRSSAETYNLLASKSKDNLIFYLQIISVELDVYISEIKELYDAKTDAEIKTNIPKIKGLMKEAVGIFEKNKDVIADKQILGDVTDANVCRAKAYLYLASYLLPENCNTVARASLFVGCYYRETDPIRCRPCTSYKPFYEDQPCSGYDNEASCIADSCSRSSCTWEGGKCAAVFGAPNNYWDFP